LYLAAPAGGAIALARRRRRRVAHADPPDPRWRMRLAVAALPTAVTLVLEWSGAMSVTSLVRAVAALPLGLMVAWTAIEVLPVARANQVH
jgi:hypothetical protein